MGTAATCAQLLSYDQSFGKEEGMKFRDYVLKIKKYVTEYCKNFYNNTEEGIAIEREHKLYRKFIKDKTAIDFVIREYISEYPELSDIIYTMIDVSPKLRYSEKIRSIANVSYDVLTGCYPNYIDDSFMNEMGINVDEQYHMLISNMYYNVIKPRFESICDYIDFVRDRVIDQLFAHTKQLLHQNIVDVYDNESNSYIKSVRKDKTFTADSWVKIDSEVANNLIICDKVINSYIGISALSKYVAVIIKQQNNDIVSSVLSIPSPSTVAKSSK